MKYHLYDLIKDTFEKVQRPLSADDIWKYAEEFKFTKQLNGYGKTPQQSIGAIIYTDIKQNGDKSTFIQISKKPPQFYLRSLYNANSNIITDGISNFKERDLHILLSTFVFSSPHFKCYTKTIYHELSSKGDKGKNKWLHPDIVGVYYPFSDYATETIRIMDSLKENSCKIFSFEMKVEIDISNLREYFFQAVSNSSWANEGYLVTLNYEDNIIDEMRRLNNAFGIGLIKLNPQDVNHSEIVFNAKEKNYLDWDMINRLVEENPNFKDFLSIISEDLKLGKVKNINDYDAYFNNNIEALKYVQSKNIL